MFTVISCNLVSSILSSWHILYNYRPSTQIMTQAQESRTSIINEKAINIRFNTWSNSSRNNHKVLRTKAKARARRAAAPTPASYCNADGRTSAGTRGDADWSLHSAGSMIGAERICDGAPLRREKSSSIRCTVHPSIHVPFVQSFRKKDSRSTRRSTCASLLLCAVTRVVVIDRDCLHFVRMHMELGVCVSPCFLITFLFLVCSDRSFSGTFPKRYRKMFFLETR
jgi:hypothetical protein